MKSIVVVLLFFLGIGLFARTYNAWIRTLLFLAIAGMVLFITYT
jgi:hypothetical protein